MVRGPLIPTTFERRAARPPGGLERRVRRAAVLLEAVLALFMIALCLAIVGGLMSEAMARIRQAEMRTRAMLLAEDKMSELILGIADVAEGQEGDFAGRPDKFTWSYTLEPTEITELSKVTVTIAYTDRGDEFVYELKRLVSPSLNLSYEKLTEIASDPSGLANLESPGLQEILNILNELPGGEQLLKRLMAGGVSSMIPLFNKLIRGDAEAMRLLEQITETTDLSEDVEGEVPTSLAAADTRRAGPPPAWTDEDTVRSAAGDPRIIRATSQPGRRGQAEPGDNETGEPSEETEPSPNAPTTREEAVRRMVEILRRLSAQGGRR